MQTASCWSLYTDILRCTFNKTSGYLYITFPSRSSKQFSLSHFPTKTWYEFEKCLRKNPKERSFHLLRGGSLKSGKVWFHFLSTCRMACLWHHPRFYNPNFAYRVQILTRQAIYVCINVTLRCVRVTIVAVEKGWVLHIVCLARTIQHAMRVRLIVYICGLWLFHIFPHYLINGTIFFKVIEHKMCWFFLKLLSKIFLLRITEQDIVINVRKSSSKMHVLVSFNWIFSANFR
jgi:hypothetical protein